MAKALLERNLIFIQGKGGVGKTVVSQAMARALAGRGKRTLWVAFEDPLRPPGEKREVGPNLTWLNAEANLAFEEYVGLKIGMAGLTRIFLGNKVIRYLGKAAPGIHELVLLGKVWHERLDYDTVVCDMPSTGYGLAMFQSVDNFARLFRGGPIHRDAEAMLDTFRDPAQSGQLIVSLPEEMPLQESLELDEHLRRFFPKNPAAFLVNRRFPPVAHSEGATPDDWTSPLATDTLDYVRKRRVLEDFNLRLWRERRIGYRELRFVPPPPRGAHDQIVAELSRGILEILQGAGA